VENNEYLSSHLITYLGNKRGLLNEIEAVIVEIQNKLGMSKTTNLDLFSGSGSVARLLKQYSVSLIVNDLEDYARVIAECYLSNHDEVNFRLYEKHYQKLQELLTNKEYFEGIIYQNYTAQGQEVTKEDRLFYTKENALIIDTIRNYVDKVEEEIKSYFLAPLLYKASVHNNTAGVFKGFYKDKSTGIGMFGGTGENALTRIKGRINIEKPILSNYCCNVEIYQEDAVQLAERLNGIDIAYLDPPYNQHPYGSNYFMLNIIANNEISDDISKVSGIPKDWNRSNFNRKNRALADLESIVESLDAKYIVISYNSEGFIKYDEFVEVLNKYGSLEIKEIEYNTYRGSRNLKNRDIYVREYLFVLEKIERG
jgi:adenine-specific DNA-methyltransferase